MPPEVTRIEVDRILSALPQRLEALLVRCGPETPKSLPDYLTFYTELVNFLKPVLEYADAQFHVGHPEDNPHMPAMRMISARKLKLEREFQSGGEDAPSRKKRIMAFGRFKLLVYFFYGSGDRAPAVYDLEYRCEMEQDPARKQELIEEAHKIRQESSTGTLDAAYAACQEGRLEEALKLCNDSIARFRGQTEAYALRARILEAMSRQSIAEGLEVEPRDMALKAAFALQETLHRLRAEFAAGSLDTDAFVERLTQSAQAQVAGAGITPRDSEAAIWKRLGNAGKLSDTAQIFLATGHYLLDRLPADYDQAPAALEFCKALETELERLVFAVFKSGAPASLGAREVPRDSCERPFQDYCYRGKPLTLGAMAFLLQRSGSSRLIEYPLLAAFREHLGSSLGEATARLTDGLRQDQIDRYRNSAAHPTLYSAAKAQDAAEWVYGLLELLVAL